MGEDPHILTAGVFNNVPFQTAEKKEDLLMSTSQNLPTTTTPQFKLYASKFPVWWTHNSIDKPDPTYLANLNDPDNQDGFKWIEVPFTFNFKDQFTGVLVVDDQYYTIFKLVDTKDDKFPEKYYLVESLTKSFNGGYELSVRLDVFVTYGLDFWVNGVKNPDINTKTVTLNRTNHAQLLIDNYYLFKNTDDFSTWTYKDPLLKFDSMPVIVANAGFYQKLKSDPNGPYYIPSFYMSNKRNLYKLSNGYEGALEQGGVYPSNVDGYYAVNGIQNGPFKNFTDFRGEVRYYVFKPPSVGGVDPDKYWCFYTVVGTTDSDTSEEVLSTILTMFSIEGVRPTFNLHASEKFMQHLIRSCSSLNSNFVGIFTGPPLTAFSQKGYVQYTSDNPKPTIDHMVFGIDITGTGVYQYALMALLPITPSKLMGINHQPPYNHVPGETPPERIPNNEFLITSLLDVNKPNNLSDDMTEKVFDTSLAIRYQVSGTVVPARNNPYILQKAQVHNLQFQPLRPSGIFSESMRWEGDLYNKGLSVPSYILGKFRIPDSVWFNEQGFRFTYITNQLNSDLTIWDLPATLPNTTGGYINYISGAMINQNNSMQIAKQQMQLGVAKSAFNGIMGMFTGGIVGGLSSAFNMSTGIAESILKYQNTQKTFDAQNAAARATMTQNINSSTDGDVAKTLMNDATTNLPEGSWWGYIALITFNFTLPLRLPVLQNDIVFYNNLIYLNGFFVNREVAISTLELDWDNHDHYNSAMMPHLYYDFNISNDILKYHYKTLNLELLQAITVLFNNGVRFWAGFPDYSRPWYWLIEE